MSIVSTKWEDKLVLATGFSDLAESSEGTRQSKKMEIKYFFHGLETNSSFLYFIRSKENLKQNCSSLIPFLKMVQTAIFYLIIHLRTFSFILTSY